MYSMMVVRSPDDEDIATIGRQPDLSFLKQSLYWYAGEKFGLVVPEPLEFAFDPGGGTYVPDFFAPPIPLMTGRMLDVLARAGVDNIDSFSAVIKTEDSKDLRTDFRAVNLLGLVKCADLSASQCDIDDPDIPGGVTFDSLTIDLTKTQGLLFFRLFEAPQGIVVHDSVRDRLEAAQLRGIEFISPSEWSG